MYQLNCYKLESESFLKLWNESSQPRQRKLSKGREGIWATEAKQKSDSQNYSLPNTWYLLSHTGTKKHFSLCSGIGYLPLFICLGLTNWSWSNMNLQWYFCNSILEQINCPFLRRSFIWNKSLKLIFKILREAQQTMTPWQH